MRHHSTISGTVFTVLAGMFLAVTAVGGPLWIHRPASDIKWYKVIDIGAVLVGAKTVSTAENSGPCITKLRSISEIQVCRLVEINKSR